MVLSLLIITLVAALSLSLVYQVTKEPIAAAKESKSVGALADVLPEFDNNPMADSSSVVVDKALIKVYRATKNGSPVGYAVETETTSGYKGLIKMMVGFEPNGNIINIIVLEHNETPGLGSKITEPDNPLLVSFVGKSPADLKMSVTKDGGDIDIITASTITSSAYTQAVERAYEAFESVAHGVAVEGVDMDEYFDRLLPNHQNVPLKDKLSISVDGVEYLAYKGVVEGNISGYAVEGISTKGYGGDIKLLVGFKPNGEIVGISVLEQNESPRFSAIIKESNNELELMFIGKKLEEINTAITAEGGDIDVLSSATVTTVAYVDAVAKAHKVFLKIAEGE